MPPIPSLSSLAAALNAVSGLPAISVAMVAAALLIIAADWRALLLILQLLYLALAVVSMRLMPPEWAVLRMLVGALIGIMWYLSARQIGYDRSGRAQPARASARSSKQQPRPTPAIRWPVLSTTMPFRIVIVVMTGVGFLLTNVSVSLPGLTPETGFLCLWLAVMALLTLALEEEPLKAGIGLLMWLAAVQIFYASLTHDARMIGVIGALELLVGLACAYLMVARAAPIPTTPDQEQRS